MDTSRLTELVKIKDKAKASKADKREFCDLWLELIREEGPGEKAFQFLIDGFPFSGMEPFAGYLKSSEDMQKTVIAFLHSSAFSRNSAVAFKCGLNLLACLIRDVETEFSTCAVIMRELPRLAVTKEKQMIRDIGRIFARNLFSVIYAKRSIPSLGYYSLSESVKDSFLILVNHGLEDSRLLPLSENERMGMKLVNDCWVMKDTEVSRMPAEQVRDEEEKPALTGTASLPTQNSTVAGEQSEVVQDWSGLYGKGLQFLKDAFVKAQEQTLNQTAANRKLYTERDRLLAENQKCREEIDRLKKELLEKDEALFAKAKMEELQQVQIGRLVKELEQKEQEICDRIEMSQIVQKNSEQQSDQELKRLGSELSTYYQDIMESEGIPMTVELGEILRDQIMDVFSVLAKHGIRADH